MKICLIPDELTHDPFTAFEIATKWGIEHYEIRYAYRWRVPNCPGWVADLAASAVKAYGVTVTAISPGLFKPVMNVDGSTVPISTDTPAEVRRHLDELLPRYIDFAVRLGACSIIAFALPKPPGAGSQEVPSIVVDALAEAAARTREAGLWLMLENGPGTWADTARAARAVIDAVGPERIGLTWDPANVIYGDLGEEPVTEGYPLIAPYVGNVHVKDAACADGRGVWKMLGEGRVDWSRQIESLRRDGYAGMLTLEPHLRYESPVNLIETLEQFVSRVRQLLGAAA